MGRSARATSADAVSASRRPNAQRFSEARVPRALGDLRGEIAQRAAPRHDLRHLGGQPEIDEPGAPRLTPFARHDDVGGFDVTVRRPGGMQGRERRADVAGDDEPELRSLLGTERRRSEHGALCNTENEHGRPRCDAHPARQLDGLAHDRGVEQRRELR